MTQRSLDFDISRGRRNANSRKAHDKLRAHKPSQRELVLAVIRMMGERGATLKEVAAYLDKLPHQLSGRFTELSIDGAIKRSQMVDRLGCSVYVVS